MTNKKKLDILDIHVTDANRTHEFDPNALLHAMYEKGADMFAPIEGMKSELSEEPAVVYETNQVTLRLSPDEVYRMTKLGLTEDEYFALRKTHGIFYEIHDDFYCEQTGRAMQSKLEEDGDAPSP